jgi:hypothetical protein
MVSASDLHDGYKWCEWLQCVHTLWQAKASLYNCSENKLVLVGRFCFIGNTKDILMKTEADISELQTDYELTTS